MDGALTLPAAVAAGVARALAGRAPPTAAGSVSPVGGGCISPAARLELRGGGSAFLKWGDEGTPPGLFAAEARSLGALAEAGEVRVPAVLAVHDVDPGEEEPGAASGWLLLEWLQPGQADALAEAELGSALARQHRRPAAAFGWDSDNFIGSLPQRNAERARWSEFWAELRLEPQLRRARDAGLLGAAAVRRFDRLSSRLDELIAAGDEDGPSLLHGDLWGGNKHPTADGGIALVDPAAYHGHREVDLAMTELFGGFGPEFHRAYRDEWPLQPEYEPVRRAVYQLYYLLVHVNLFGEGYAARTLSTLARAGF